MIKTNVGVGPKIIVKCFNGLIVIIVVVFFF